jgi:hypothetical protein
MRRAQPTSSRHIVHRLASLACVAILGVAGAGCGSGSKPGTNNSPAVTTTPSGQGSPAPTSPQSGGAILPRAVDGRRVSSECVHVVHALAAFRFPLGGE